MTVTHQRRAIKTALVAMLDTGGIVDAGNVFSGRRRAVDADELPVINVHAGPESADPLDNSGSTYRRDLDLIIEITAAAPPDDSVEDVLDDLAALVEAALAADPTIADTAVTTTLKTSVPDDPDARAETNIGRLKLTYSTLYVA